MTASERTPGDPFSDVVAAVILAAGSSSRMGRPKQLLLFDGKPILQHVVEAAAGVLSEVVVVLGHASEEIREALSLPAGARAVLNPTHASGQASSLAHGLSELSPGVTSALVLVGDEPGIRPEAIRAMLHAGSRSRADVLRATYGTGPGHPVLLRRTVWAALTDSSGDLGARGWMEAHPDRVEGVPLPFPAPIEVDTEEDYLRLLGEA